MRFLRAVRAFAPFKAFLATLLALAFTASAHAAGDPQDGVNGEKPRVAFVLGSNAYTGVPPLENAINDAKLVAASLRRLNFKVIEGHDLSLAEFKNIFIENEALIASADAVVFYYAGHAFQIDGQNYLVPTDAQLKSAFEIDSSTLRLDTIIRQLQHPDRPTLIFLDACRDNPLPESVQLEARQDGLAQIEAGLNTFIAFATQPGNVSNDGHGSNSPFATALSKHLETPGLSISDLVIEVRNETRALTLERQSPWDQSSLLSQFYFTERQRIDQQKLFAAAAAISSNQELMVAYNEELNSGYAFQPAIFRTAHRAITLLDERPDEVHPALKALIEDPSAPAQASLQLASTDATATASAAGAPSNVTVEGDREFTVLGSLQFSTPGEEDEAAAAAREANQRQLARNMQTELQRLGCYRMGIDGLWGPGSKRAFQNYLSGTKQTAPSLEPSVQWLNTLIVHPGRVCRAPVKYTPKREVKPKVASRGSSARRNVRRSSNRVQKQRSFKQRAVKGRTRAAKRARRTQRQNALPPDLGMGVGIGM